MILRNIWFFSLPESKQLKLFGLSLAIFVAYLIITQLTRAIGKSNDPTVKAWLHRMMIAMYFTVGVFIALLAFFILT